MKKIIFSFIAIVSIFNYSCRKEDNPNLPDLDRGIPVTKIVAQENSEFVIDVTKDPAMFVGKFDVGLLYPDDKPQKMDIVIIKNGDKSNVKTFKTDVATFPASMEITGAELITLFGSPIALGDFFDIAADITLLDGRKLLAFPTTGVQYAAGIPAIPGSAPFLRYSAICKFDANEYAGDFIVVKDEWEDYPVGATVAVSKVDDTHLSFVYGADNPKPIILTITPTNAIVVDKQAYGTYSWGTQYGQFFVESIAHIDDVVKPCDQTLSVLLKHSVGAGPFGEYRITLRKKN